MLELVQSVWGEILVVPGWLPPHFQSRSSSLALTSEMFRSVGGFFAGIMARPEKTFHTLLIRGAVQNSGWNYKGLRHE